MGDLFVHLNCREVDAEAKRVLEAVGIHKELMGEKARHARACLIKVCKLSVAGYF